MSSVPLLYMYFVCVYGVLLNTDRYYSIFLRTPFLLYKDLSYRDIWWGRHQSILYIVNKVHNQVDLYFYPRCAALAGKTTIDPHLATEPSINRVLQKHVGLSEKTNNLTIAILCHTSFGNREKKNTKRNRIETCLISRSDTFHTSWTCESTRM